MRYINEESCDFTIKFITNMNHVKFYTLDNMKFILSTIHYICIISIGTQKEKLKNPKPLVGLCSHASVPLQVQHRTQEARPSGQVYHKTVSN